MLHNDLTFLKKTTEDIKKHKKHKFEIESETLVNTGFKTQKTQNTEVPRVILYLGTSALDSMNPLTACVAVQGVGLSKGQAPPALHRTLTQTPLE